MNMTTTALSPITISPEVFGKVAVLLGGNSAEREVSLASGKAIFNALQDYGIDVHAFDPSQQHLCELVAQKFDRVFIALHGRGGEDGSIQGALEQLGVPYTGSGVTGSALSIDKVLSKLIWHARKLPTANYMVVSKDKFSVNDASGIIQHLGANLMVKPSLEGSSLGMAQANTEQSLISAIKTAFEYDQQVLIEAFITGPEYTVSILGEHALPSITMKSASGFYDYFAKYKASNTVYDCPSGLSDADEAYVRQLSLDAFNALQGKGWGRIDIMRDSALDSNGKPCGTFYLLESNTVPGMTQTSLVPKAAKQAGLNFEQLVLHILAQTLDAEFQTLITQEVAQILQPELQPNALNTRQNSSSKRKAD
jgi:D-alanine-D-alanine ligase